MQGTPSIPGQRLGMMTKYWEPGKVKTRLAGSWLQSPARLNHWTGTPRETLPITEENAFNLASKLHYFFVLYLLKRLRNCGTERELVGSPHHRMSELTAAANSSWRVVEQGEGDLGDRMSRWFLRESTATGLADNGPPGNGPFGNPPTPAQSVLIGSDCPLLDAGAIANAFQRLEKDDLVLGPASDGGYYLIGMSSHADTEQVRSIFDGIAWSTSDVLAETVRAAEQIGWRVVFLETRDDVDSVEDLDRLLALAKAKSEYSNFFDELIKVIDSVPEMS